MRAKLVRMAKFVLCYFGLHQFVMDYKTQQVRCGFCGKASNEDWIQGRGHDE